MTAIPFPTTSAPGKTTHESAGRLINAYAEDLAVGARSQTVRRRAPGLRNFAVTSQSGFRGSLPVASTLYAAFKNNVTSFDAGGNPTNVGTLGGDAKVFWARNNKAPTPDVIVVDPDNGAAIVTASSVTGYTGGGVLPAVNSVCFQDGYFFLTSGDGRCFASGLNATTMDPSTFISCEGKPDSLLRAIPFTELYLAGTDSIEVWHDTAEAVPAFPYTRVKVIQKGIIGRYAVSGFENGIDKGIIFVGGDRVVYALNGYSPVKISTADVDRAIGSFIDAGGDPTTIEMFPFVVGGRSCVALRSSAFTWVLDIDAVRWHERESYGVAYWRATSTVNAFSKWLAGDSASGNLVEVTDASRDEAGAALVYTVESGPVSAFPNKLAVKQASFEIAQGVGIATGDDPTQTDPSVAISYSDDGGLTWSIPRIRPLGRQQETPGPIKLTKCGTTKNQGRRWRLTVSDAVDVELTGGDQSNVLKRG